MVKKHKLFPISKPYGYHPPAVEEAVGKYNQVVLQLKEAVMDRDEVIKNLNEENIKIKSELQRMQLEMSMLEIPGMDQAQEHMILSQFKDQKTGDSRFKDESFMPNPIPDVGHVNIPIVSSGESEKKVVTLSANTSTFEIVE